MERTEFRLEQRRPGGEWEPTGSSHLVVGHDAPSPERLVRFVELRRERTDGYDHRLVRRNVTTLRDAWEDAT